MKKNDWKRGEGWDSEEDWDNAEGWDSEEDRDNAEGWDSEEDRDNAEGWDSEEDRDNIDEWEEEEGWDSDDEWEEEVGDEDGSRRWLLFVIPSAIAVILAVFFGVRLFLNRTSGEEVTIAEAEQTEIPVEGSIIAEDMAGTENMEPAETTEEPLPEENETEPETDVEDPQQQAQEGNGAAAEISQETVQAGVGENTNVSIGIDVAKYQGTIDWQQVAASGVQFAMIRVGYRTQTDGQICEDPTAKYNMQEATKNGIKIGVYFFSTAVNDAEALEEANWTADYIAKYQITYPVAYNCEGYNNVGSRQYGIEKEIRSNAALAFLDGISGRGYTPMFYAAKNELEGDRDWNATAISSKYKIWVSQYPVSPFPETPASSYSGSHAMWQYTNRGTIPGIPKNVDLNVAYFGYDTVAAAQDSEAPKEVGANVEALMNFTEVNETVTAKDVVNLRDRPGQGEDSTVLRTLSNGETAQRTGVSDSGWSRLIIDGQKFYAVSSFITTDTSYVTPQPVEEPAPVDNGIKTQFTAVNENVTAKIEVNLRTLPSVTNPDATVAAVLKNGEWVTRTGISDNGWSRVDYNGQILYCVSSYLSVG